MNGINKLTFPSSFIYAPIQQNDLFSTYRGDLGGGREEIMSANTKMTHSGGVQGKPEPFPSGGYRNI